MTKLKTGTWIVVADSEKALLLENLGDGDFPNFSVIEKETQENPPSREQAANRPGRVSDSTGQQRSAMSDTDWHQLAKDRFADDLAEMLNRHALKQDFSSLVLIAAPHVLGEVRKHLHGEVESRIVAQIDKNLTNLPLDKIEEQVKQDLKNVA